MELNLDLILADACPNFVKTDPSGEKLDQMEYTIELHCVRYTIVAECVNVPIYDDDNDEWLVPPKYNIISYTKE